MSPLLFALVVDILLRRISREVDGVKVFAFADDIALVLRDVGNNLNTLSTIFQDLERIAGLSLNLKKCVLIPLWPSELSSVRTELARGFPFWANVQVEFSSTYLGVQIGPLADRGFWDKALRKFKALRNGGD